MVFEEDVASTRQNLPQPKSFLKVLIGALYEFIQTLYLMLSFLLFVGGDTKGASGGGVVAVPGSSALLPYKVSSVVAQACLQKADVLEKDVEKFISIRTKENRKLARDVAAWVDSAMQMAENRKNVSVCTLLLLIIFSQQYFFPIFSYY